VDFADLDVRHLGLHAWRQLSCLDRDHFVVFLGKDLLCPSGNATADKDKACNADSNACHKACKAEGDAEGEKNGPRRTCRHLYGLSLILFRSAVIHHKSPPDQVNNCKYHDPHGIYEVPIKGDNTEALTLP